MAVCITLVLFTNQCQSRALQKASDSLCFYFGSSQKKAKDIGIHTAMAYDSKIGYGFDFNTAADVRLSPKAFKAEKPSYFSVKLPQGNYQIEVAFLGTTKPSTMTIKAESRRLMIKELSLKKDEKITKKFNINIRSAVIDKNSSIDLKEREKSDLNWDDKVSLEFLGDAWIQSIKISPLRNPTMVYLAGDSTVTDQDLEPWASWGQFITNYFDLRIVVANYAVSGSSLSSFKDSNRLRKILSVIKPGDYLMVEFGHNDQKLKGEENSAWRSYTDYLSYYVEQARTKGAIPILISPTQRRFFNEDHHIKPTHGEFPDAMRAVAKKMNVPFIDLTQMTSVLYESWTEEVSRKAFVQYPAHSFPGQEKALEDNTHFNSFGANEIALCITQGIRELDLPLKKHLINTPAIYHPQNPNQYQNWTLPMSRRFETAKPLGN